MAQDRFHVRECGACEAGASFRSFDAAHRYALDRAREIMRESLRTGVLPIGYALEVADPSGRPLATVPYTEGARPT